MTSLRKSPDLLLNGRFLTRQMTGVDRTALNLGRQLALLSKGSGVTLNVALPAGAPDDPTIRAALDLPTKSKIFRSRFSGYFWEQAILPFVRSRAMLLSLCNTGPALRRRQLVLMHDAQVFDAPDSYSLPFRATYRLLLPWLARRADLIATVSAHSRERLNAHGVGRDREIHVLPNAADHLLDIAPDPAIVERAGLQHGGYLLALGSAAPHKNLVTLLNSLPDGSPPLVIAGGGTEVAGMLAQSPVGKAIHLGRVSDAELKALYCSAQMFLFPSLTEGFGLPPIEAMTCGCPVIVSRGGAIPEVCGDAAIYCDALDREAWKGAIRRLAGDEPMRHRLSRIGREHAARLTWQDTARRIVELARLADEQRPAVLPQSSHHGSTHYSAGIGDVG